MYSITPRMVLVVELFRKPICSLVERVISWKLSFLVNDVLFRYFPFQHCQCLSLLLGPMGLIVISFCKLRFYLSDAVNGHGEEKNKKYCT